MVGEESNVKILRHTYATKNNAYRAAKSAWEQLQRGGVQPHSGARVA